MTPSPELVLPIFLLPLHYIVVACFPLCPSLDEKLLGVRDFPFLFFFLLYFQPRAAFLAYTRHSEKGSWDNT